MYEIMRYWDEDHPEWNADIREFAAAWRNQPKWVVSRSLKSVGPNATLVSDDVEASDPRAEGRARRRDRRSAGPKLAQRLTELGLIDEYRLYLHPVVLGQRHSHSSPAPGRRSALWPASGLARA